MMRTVQSPAVRVLSLSLALLVVAISASHQSYDPTMRNYVETCDEMAQLAGDNFCRVFDICCRDRAKNKLNGDRCQLTDPTNGCQLTAEGNVEFLRCRAYNCTPEVTTTTTTMTTTTTARALFLSSSSIDYSKQPTAMATGQKRKAATVTRQSESLTVLRIVQSHCSTLFSSTLFFVILYAIR
uniref:Uncharacterized protein n=1 Tax=Wuchereria bancrofti TaxID=6293 RepID=A0AAF5RV92_WUCBA